MEVSWDFYHVRISAQSLPRSSGIWKLFFDRNMALKDGPNKMKKKEIRFKVAAAAATATAWHVSY